jgi:hypothetical protein
MKIAISPAAAPTINAELTLADLRVLREAVSDVQRLFARRAANTANPPAVRKACKQRSDERFELLIKLQNWSKDLEPPL